MREELKSGSFHSVASAGQAPMGGGAGGWLNRWLLVELLASALTLAGIYIGSTTAAGASLYLASLVFWYALTVGKGLWGLMPLNVASTVVTALNLWRAVA